MNKSVQILMLLALFPMLGMAREETLEERKKRVVRKYLREEVTLTQSAMVVPSDLLEDERITDSEKFKGVDVDLQRQGASSTLVVQPPPQRRPAPRRTDRSWLLDDMDDATDAYGRPIDSYTAATMDSGDDLWSAWDGTSEKKTAQALDRQDRHSYDQDRISPYGRQNPEKSANGGRNSQNDLYGNQQNSRFGRPADSSRTDLFGRQRSEYSSSLNLQGSRTPIYGSDPEQGMLISPLSKLNSSREGRSTTERKQRQGYTPYQSPYDKQREQRGQKKKMQPQRQQEFKRPDSYQQWRKRNKTYDPTADDAYINEMMQRNRR